MTAGVVGYLVASAAPPPYECNRAARGPITTDLETQRAAGQLAQTDAQLGHQPAVLAPPSASLGLRNIEPAPVSADASEVTRLLTIHVATATRARAGIANA